VNRITIKFDKLTRETGHVRSTCWNLKSLW